MEIQQLVTPVLIQAHLNNFEKPRFGDVIMMWFKLIQ